MASRTAPFAARVESGTHAARIALSGDLDIATTPTLNEHLAQIEASGVATIVLDLRALTFIDTTAIHAFVAANARAVESGRRLLVVGAGPPVQRLIELTGTQILLQPDDDVVTGLNP